MPLVRKMFKGQKVWVEIDANNDDTTGFVFAVNPSSAQFDSQLSRDAREDSLWDGVWQASARKTERGWSGASTRTPTPSPGCWSSPHGEFASKRSRR